jgi:arylsulfatase A-like enzyme
MALIVLVGAAIIAFLLMFPPRRARVEAPFALITEGPGPGAVPGRFTASVDLFRDTRVTRGRLFAPPSDPTAAWPWQSEVDERNTCTGRPTLERNFGLGERFDAGGAADAEDQAYETRRAVALGAGEVLRFSPCVPEPPVPPPPEPTLPGETVVTFSFPPNVPLVPVNRPSDAGEMRLRFALGALPTAPEASWVDVRVLCVGADPSAKPTRRLPVVRGRWTDHDIALTPEICPGGPNVVAFNADAGPGTLTGAVLVAHPRLFYTPATPAPPRPNVVLINVDTLLPRTLGYMGATRGASPNLDRLAAEGISWDQTYANGNWSKPSHASFFTSQRPHDLGLKFWRNANDALEKGLWRGLQHRTLVHAFRDAGYFTYGAASNLFDSPVLPTGVDLGFERFTDNPTSMDHPLELIDDLERFLATQRDAPFFLFFNPETPHYKYRPPREYLWQTGGIQSADTLDWDLYFGEVAYADAYVGRLLALLDHYGMRENTLVMVTSDHGEQLSPELAQAVYLRDPFDPFDYYFKETTLFRHGLSPYDEEWHVPWIVRLPSAFGPTAAGTRIAAQVEVMDQAPTLLALAGLPPEPGFRGRVVYPQAPADTPALMEGRNFDAVRLPPWKYVRRVPGADLVSPVGKHAWRWAPESLFDLSSPEGERRDVAAEHPEQLARLRSTWHTLRGRPQNLWRLRLGADARPVSGEIDLGGDAPPLQFALDPKRTPELAFSADEAADLALTADCPHAAVRVGPLALPLAEGYPLRLGPDLARATRALTPPTPAGALQIWHTPVTDGGPETTDTGALGKDLQDALRAWGYAN